MNANPAFLALPLLFLACADTNRNLAACDALRHNHERIAEIESSLAKLETEPPSEKRGLRKADLVLRLTYKNRTRIFDFNKVTVADATR